jgi:hypothetical protein
MREHGRQDVFWMRAFACPVGGAAPPTTGALSTVLGTLLR